MAPLRTIGELATAAQVPTSTIRYYERTGLLKASGRSDGNYRLYSDEALELLRFIRAAQATGFTLDDVTKLLGHRHESIACGEVQAVIEERLAHVKQQMDHLKHVQAILRTTLERCKQTAQAGTCSALKALDAATNQPVKAPRRSRSKKRNARS